MGYPLNERGWVDVVHRAARGPARSHLPWNDREDRDLAEAYTFYRASSEDLAQFHQRSLIAVEMRLKHLGVMDPANDFAPVRTAGTVEPAVSASEVAIRAAEEVEASRRLDKTKRGLSAGRLRALFGVHLQTCVRHEEQHMPWLITESLVEMKFTLPGFRKNGYVLTNRGKMVLHAVLARAEDIVQ